MSNVHGYYIFSSIVLDDADEWWHKGEEDGTRESEPGDCYLKVIFGVNKNSQLIYFSQRINLTLSVSSLYDSQMAATRFSEIGQN